MEETPGPSRKGGREGPSRRPVGSRQHTPKFPELPPKYSASREGRKIAEKLRRNMHNDLLEDIKQLVPMIKDKKKKSDIAKTSILRVAGNYIRLKKLFPNETNILPAITNLAGNFEHLKAVNGTMVLLTVEGRILYVSEQVQSLSGYTQLDLLGLPIFEFVHQGDHAKLRKYLSRDQNRLFSFTNRKAAVTPRRSATNSSSGPSTPSSVPNSQSWTEDDGSLASGSRTSPSPSENISSENVQTTFPRQSFYLRFKTKPKSKGDLATFHHMHIVGHFRESVEGERGLSPDLQFVFVGIMKPVNDRPIVELSLTEAIQDQYITRHLPDGRITSTDHRIATIAGYLPTEVQGKSAFNYMLGDDLPWAAMALRDMFSNPQGEGITTYRLRTKNGDLICLQSRGFIEFNKTTKQIQNFLCINTLIRPEDTERMLEDQRNKYAPYVAELQVSAFNQSNKTGNGVSQPSSSNQLKAIGHSGNTANKRDMNESRKRVHSESSSESDKRLKSTEPDILDESDDRRPLGHLRSPRAASDAWDCVSEDGSLAPATPASTVSVATSPHRAMSPINDRGVAKNRQVGVNEIEETDLLGQYGGRSGPAHREEDGLRIIDVEQDSESSFDKNSKTVYSRAIEKELCLKNRLETSVNTALKLSPPNNTHHHQNQGYGAVNAYNSPWSSASPQPWDNASQSQFDKVDDPTATRWSDEKPAISAIERIADDLNKSRDRPQQPAVAGENFRGTKKTDVNHIGGGQHQAKIATSPYKKAEDELEELLNVIQSPSELGKNYDLMSSDDSKLDISTASFEEPTIVQNNTLYNNTHNSTATTANNSHFPGGAGVGGGSSSLSFGSGHFVAEYPMWETYPRSAANASHSASTSQAQPPMIGSHPSAYQSRGSGGNARLLDTIGNPESASSLLENVSSDNAFTMQRSTAASGALLPAPTKMSGGINKPKPCQDFMTTTDSCIDRQSFPSNELCGASGNDGSFEHSLGLAGHEQGMAANNQAAPLRKQSVIMRASSSSFKQNSSNATHPNFQDTSIGGIRSRPSGNLTG